MSRYLWAVTTILALCLGATSAGAAQVQFYGGQPGAVRFGPWGNGSIGVSQVLYIDDGPSLAVTTRGLFEGGRIELSRPADMAPFWNNRAASMVVIEVSLTGGAGAGFPGGLGFPMMPGMGGAMMPGMGGGAGPGMGGGMMPGMGGGAGPGMGGGMMPGMGGGAGPGMGGGMMPGMGGGAGPGMGGGMMPGMGGGMMPGMGGGAGPGMGGGMMPGMGGGMMPGMGGAGGAGAPGAAGGAGMIGMAATPVARPLERIRVQLLTSKGTLDSGPIRVDPAVSQLGPWRRINIPLSDFAAPSDDMASAKVTGVVITGDSRGTFYVGRLFLVSEDAPLVAKIEGPDPMVVPVNQPVTFRAASQAPGVEARYTWSWDERMNEDGSGQSATTTFTRPGYYRVTLKVEDTSGERQMRWAQVRVRATGGAPALGAAPLRGQ